MNLANKSFRENRTGEVVKVIDSFENIAVLENRSKIDTRRLLDTNYYTEYIDPNQFIKTTSSSAYNSIFETIKSIPTDKIPVDDNEIPVQIPNQTYDPYTPTENSPVVYTSSIEDEKAELARKYGVSVDNVSATDRQNQAFARLLGEEASNELPAVQTEQVQRVEIVRDDEGSVVSSDYVTPESPKREHVAAAVVEKDPYEMFRGIKRSVEFKLDLPLTNSIPKIEFIEMMEESYDKSIIEFLAHDITQQILNDPESLRKSIETKIREMVYGKQEIEVTVKKAAPKRAPKPNTAVGEKPGVNKPVRKKEDPSQSTKPAAKRRTKKEIQDND